MIQERSGTETELKEPPRIKSLIAKMQVYNASEGSLREAIRAAADAGVNPVHHGAVVEYLRKSGQQDLADYVEGIGDDGFRELLAHYGVVKEQEPKADPKGITAPEPPPTGEEIFSAMLDAFEQDVNLADKKKLVKWMRDNQNEAVAAWLEGLERADYFKALSSFFGNLGRVREKLPAEMSQESVTEQVVRPGKALPVEPPPEEKLPEPEEAPPKPEDMNTVLMDAYLEGVDISRRSQLVKELDKAGYGDAAEFIDGLSLSAFYMLLSEFFSGLAKALEESKERVGMRRLTEQMDPRREWLWMSPADRVETLIAGGVPSGEAETYGGYEWHELPDYAQKAFKEAVVAVTERRKRAEIELPFRRGKMSKMLKMEAPEELLPVEIEEAIQIASVLREEFGLEEAAKRAAKQMGKKKGMPEGIVANLERFLGKVMREDFEQKSVPTTMAPKAPEKEIKPPEGPKKEPEKEKRDEQKMTPAAREFISKKIRILRREGYPQKQAIAIAHKMARDAGYDVPEPAEEGERYYDVEEPGKDPVDEPLKVEDEAILGDLRRLSLMPSKFQGESKSLPPPKAILIEAISSGGSGSTVAPAGVIGAPGVGVLDVFSYGGYLEKTLPYLIAATVSRMDEDDRSKFVNAFRKFVETNDIVQLTRLAGDLADIVEWGDATQEGAELVKTFRFLSDFLNMMRASVDYTKKALS